MPYTQGRSFGRDAVAVEDVGTSLAIYSSAFFSGFLTMALEMVLGRTFILYFGSTVYTWGALISVFLTGMTAGYLLGGRIADRLPQRSLIAGLFLAAAMLTLLVPMLGDAAINHIQDVIDDLRYAALLSSLVLAFLPAALLAAACPLCARLLIKSTNRAGTVSGRLSALASGGSITGTLLTSFYLVPNHGVNSIYHMLAGIGATVAGVFLIIEFRNRLQSSLVGAASGIAVVCVLVSILFTPVIRAAEPAPASHNDGILERVESEYETIFIEKRDTSISLVFGLRAMRHVQSVIDTARPHDLIEQPARHMTAALAYTDKAPERVAVIGFGGGRAPAYLLDQLPNVRVYGVEIDPAVIRLAEKYFGIAPGPRLNIYAKDGRVYLKQIRETFDLIYLDAYRGAHIPFHLTTREFYQLVKQRLSPGGVIAQNVNPSKILFDSLYVTLRQVFRTVDTYRAGANVILIAYDGPRLTPDELTKAAERAQRRLNMKYDLRDLVTARMDLRIPSTAKILTDDFAPVEVLNARERRTEMQ